MRYASGQTHSTVLQVIVLCLFLFASLSSCSSKDDSSKTGQLRKLEIGDTWSWIIRQSDSDQVTVVREVVGETNIDGNPCYIIQMTLDPQPPKVVDMTETISRRTLDTIVLETTWESDDVEGETEKEVTNFSYSYSDSPYPLSVGKRWTSFWVEETQSIWTDNILTFEDSARYEVESIEDIIVDAGTFSCFKIVKYNHGKEQPSSISWVSAQTNFFPVKQASADSVEAESENYKPPMELTSYSLSEH